MSRGRESVSVVVPVYMSGAIVEELYQQLSHTLGASVPDYQIVLVDDDSPDDTWRAVSALAKADARVTAVRLRRNAGYDAAVMAGLGFALHPWVVVMDDDLQHEPADIPTLLDELAKGFDVVYANFERKRQSALKNAGSWLNGKLAEVALKKPREIYLSPFKTLRGEVVREVLRHAGPYPYVDGLIFQVTSSVGQVTVRHHDRAAGRGRYGPLRSLGIMANFVTSFSLLPLRVATVGGLLISLVAGISAVVLVLWKLLLGFDVDPPGWTSIVLVVTILGGAQLMALGIVGEYVGRSHLSLGGRRPYVVRDVVSQRVTGTGASETGGPDSAAPRP